jgi:hypothetical protein
MPNFEERLIPYSVPPVLYVQIGGKNNTFFVYFQNFKSIKKRGGLFTAACGGI